MFNRKVSACKIRYYSYTRPLGFNMNEKINERKNIIISLKSNLGEPTKGIEKRIEFPKGITILNLILTFISGGILVLINY